MLASKKLKIHCYFNKMLACFQVLSFEILKILRFIQSIELGQLLQSF